MTINLAGRWAFRLDPDDQGLDSHWYESALPETVQLPGAIQAQGIGEDVSVESDWIGSFNDRSYFDDPKYAPYREPGNVKVPFWLQPDKAYLGAAWYQLEVEIPQEWAGERVTLQLERPHWETRVWLDGQSYGSDLSLSTPHTYELGHALEPGAHQLTIRVDNRMVINVGPNSHSVSDHTQGAWNGIAGALTLQPGSPVWIEQVQVYPDLAHALVRVEISTGNQLGVELEGEIQLSAQAYNSEVDHQVEGYQVPVTIPAQGGKVQILYAMGSDFQTWDEFSPALYRLNCTLLTSAGQDQQEVSFGMREVRTDGTQFNLNGRRIFLRGTLECCIFPLTGYPPTDTAAWKRIIRICQAHGLNHIRFHSWCPPEAAFEVADEMGFYYQVECASWANQGATLGEGEPVDRWLYSEAERIIAAYGNHPSFLLMAYGNEPAGQRETYLGIWLDYWRGRDARRVHTSGAGWPMVPENEFHNIYQPRLQLWGAGNDSRINGQPPETESDYRDWVSKFDCPIISHEIGQWCVYPDFDEIAKYTGHLKAKNFEIFRDFLDANHMGDQARDFLMASGKLQTLCYKEDIEAALRTQGFGGFQLLDLHDFPGQGTALVGILDPFWDSKPYVSPAEFNRFCGPTIPLARLSKRYWHTDETFQAQIDLAHYGPLDLEQIQLYWRLEGEHGSVVGQGELAVDHLPTGGLSECGTITCSLAAAEPAARYRLIAGAAELDCENDWDIWLFAPNLPELASGDLLITDTLDAAARDRLQAGGDVLILANPADVRVESEIGFSSVFWNTSWTQGQVPHTLGILCDPDHPVFASFPTDYHSDWQWWQLIHGSAALVLEGLPPELRPLVQPIDTWFEARRLGLLIEAQVGPGRLMVCSMDLSSDLDERLVARQLRHSLLNYLNSPEFQPKNQVSLDALKALFTPVAE